MNTPLPLRLGSPPTSAPTPCPLPPDPPGRVLLEATQRALTSPHHLSSSWHTRPRGQAGGDTQCVDHPEDPDGTSDYLSAKAGDENPRMNQHPLRKDSACRAARVPPDDAHLSQDHPHLAPGRAGLSPRPRREHSFGP